MGHNTPLGHHTDCDPTGLGQYDRLGEYCSPYTASPVLITMIYILHAFSLTSETNLDPLLISLSVVHYQSSSCQVGVRCEEWG